MVWTLTRWPSKAFEPTVLGRKKFGINFEETFMKKSKWRPALQGDYLEWPKTMDWAMINTLENLPSDTVVSVVCAWEDGADDTHAAEALSYTRRQAQEKEHSMTTISRFMFVVKATLRFIQCLLQDFKVRALNIDAVGHRGSPECRGFA